MANFKRRKPKQQVRCTLCTPDRWLGNYKERFDGQTRRRKAAANQAIQEALK